MLVFIRIEKNIYMKTSEEKKALVKQQYSELALNADELKGKCCCGTKPMSPSKKVFTIMSEDYSKLKGYEADADLGVGCGLPTEYAGIKEGDTVIDLGSGAGNDAFIARAEVGESGKVIGIDFSPQMIIWGVFATSSPKQPNLGPRSSASTRMMLGISF